MKVGSEIIPKLDRLVVSASSCLATRWPLDFLGTSVGNLYVVALDFNGADLYHFLVGVVGW